VLGRDPETIRLKEILDCVRNAGKNIKLAGDRDEVEIEDLLDDVDQSIAKALAEKKLQELILKLSPAELKD
jgi:DNA-binding IscR family transcriptional regulator